MLIRDKRFILYLTEIKIMKKCQECKQYKNDVKSRINKYLEAIKYDYTKQPKQNLCQFCYDELAEGI